MEKKGSSEPVILQIMQVAGKDEEKVDLAQPVKCAGNIEGWLKTLEVSMQATLKDITRVACGACFNMALKDFCLAYCS